MNSINIVKNLRILYFGKENKEIKKSNAHTWKKVHQYSELYILLIILLYLIHVRILSSGLYLTHDSVGAIPVSILQWPAEIEILNAGY